MTKKASKKQTKVTDKKKSVKKTVKAVEKQVEAQTSEVTRMYLLTDKTKAAAHNTKSRRALVIEMLETSMYDKKSIAEVLTDVFQIADYKQNLKCVSGTCYDLRNTKQSHSIVEKEDRLCVKRIS